MAFDEFDQMAAVSRMHPLHAPTSPVFFASHNSPQADITFDKHTPGDVWRGAITFRVHTLRFKGESVLYSKLGDRHTK